jgi:hypothetical protein
LLFYFYFRIWQVFTSVVGRILLPVLAGYYFRSWQAFTFHVSSKWLPSQMAKLTASGLEVDFVLGDHEVAIEVKATSQANNRHLKGLISFAEECTVRDLILVPTIRHGAVWETAMYFRGRCSLRSYGLVRLLAEWKPAGFHGAVCVAFHESEGKSIVWAGRRGELSLMKK